MTMHFSGTLKELGEYFAHLAISERTTAARMTTHKEARFHEGKARAYDDAAEWVRTYTVTDESPMTMHLFGAVR